MFNKTSPRKINTILLSSYTKKFQENIRETKTDVGYDTGDKNVVEGVNRQIPEDLHVMSEKHHTLNVYE